MRVTRSSDRVDTRAGHYERKLETKAGEVTPRVTKLRKLPFETAFIERHRRRESSVGELPYLLLDGVVLKRSWAGEVETSRCWWRSASALMVTATFSEWPKTRKRTWKAGAAFCATGATATHREHEVEQAALSNGGRLHQYDSPVTSFSHCLRHPASFREWFQARVRH
jgi:hypothetical protein